MTAPVFSAAGGTTQEALAASVSPTSEVITATSTTVTTGTFTVTVSGGQAPYSYSWATYTNRGDTATPNSPSSASTTYAVETNYTGENDFPLICTVTDVAGNLVTPSGYVLVFKQHSGGELP